MSTLRKLGLLAITVIAVTATTASAASAATWQPAGATYTGTASNDLSFRFVGNGTSSSVICTGTQLNGTFSSPASSIANTTPSFPSCKWTTLPIAGATVIDTTGTTWKLNGTNLTIASGQVKIRMYAEAARINLVCSVTVQTAANSVFANGTFNNTTHALTLTTGPAYNVVSAPGSWSAWCPNGSTGGASVAGNVTNGGGAYTLTKVGAPILPIVYQ